MIGPDRPLGTGYLVTEIDAATESPRHLELAQCPRLEPDEHDGVVLGFDRVDQGVGPRHHLHRAVSLADETADDLDAVTSQVDDRPSAGLVLVPEPGAVGTGMGFPGTHPGDVTDGPGFDRGDGLECLRGVAEILQIAGEDAGRFDSVEDAFGLLAGAGQWLRAQNRLAGVGGSGDYLLGI